MRVGSLRIENNESRYLNISLVKSTWTIFNDKHTKNLNKSIIKKYIHQTIHRGINPYHSSVNIIEFKKPYNDIIENEKDRKKFSLIFDQMVSVTELLKNNKTPKFNNNTNKKDISVFYYDKDVKMFTTLDQLLNDYKYLTTSSIDSKKPINSIYRSYNKLFGNTFINFHYNKNIKKEKEKIINDSVIKLDEAYNIIYNKMISMIPRRLYYETLHYDHSFRDLPLDDFLIFYKSNNPIYDKTFNIFLNELKNLQKQIQPQRNISDIISLYRSVAFGSENSPNYKNYEKIAAEHWFGRKKRRMKKMIDVIYERYPLLKVIKYGTYKLKPDDIIDYINSIHDSKKNTKGEIK
jgi:hypothetical protein